MSGLGGVDSAAPSFAMWDLSRIARSAPAVAAAFDGASVRAQQLQGPTTPRPSEFLKDFDEFLFEYGARAPNEWDLRSDSWET